MGELIIPYKPRDIFVPYHNNTKRFSCTVAHRRAGKTVARINKIVKKAVQSQNLNPRFGFLAPYYVQAKEIAWPYLKYYTDPLEPLGRKINESELSITLGHNNATIRLYGAENAERMRGLYFDGIAADEAQGISGATLRTIILPSLADRLGWLDISGTPRGWENLLGEIVKIAKDNPEEWFLQILRASETGVLPQSELDLQRKLMSENEYEQEYECSFDAAITGAVYGREMGQATAENRIRLVPYDQEKPVHTIWDLGWNDNTSIWFVQRIGKEYRIIDYLQVSQTKLSDIVRELQLKGYVYGKDVLPHDAKHKTLAGDGKSIQNQLEALGRTVVIAPDLSISDGINAARTILASCWFDEAKCAQGLNCLKQYRYEYDDNLKTFKRTPRHDWASHGADAFRYFAVSTHLLETTWGSGSPIVTNFGNF